MSLLAFIAVCASLLGTPGPTNTLLATSGAEVGWRRSASLLAAELLGYLLAIAVLRLGLGPFIASRPIVATVLQAVVALYLVYLAMALWRRSSLPLAQGRSITFALVFLTTLLNPKGLIFAFTLLPAAPAGFSALLPWLAVLSAEIVAIGFGWVLLGSTLQRSLQDPAKARLGYRASAAVLGLLASMMAARSLVSL
ncbi:LysE family translocator [Bosea sp. 2KB_26]|uniref:LysE family translocator n=1 Tax=Bosea sp. 2KB_26 TaxID=3237475 RepID=UPI003F93ACED